MKSTTYKWLLAAFLLSSMPAFAADVVDEIIVTADFRERPVSELEGTAEHHFSTGVAKPSHIVSLPQP